MMLLVIVLSVWLALFFGLLLAMRLDREDAPVHPDLVDGPRTVEDVLTESPERWPVRQAG
jgi:hypothetical protein